MERLVTLVAEKTGYTRDLLEPDLDLEADLGIDTVKQAEIFGIVRTEFNIPRDDSVQLRDYPTLNKMVDYLSARANGAPVAPPPAPTVEAAAPAMPVLAAPSPAPTPAPGSRDPTALLAQVRSLVAEKTGYPVEMLEADLDLEADLGIDTVKQAELFGILRERHGIPRIEGLQLKDYNTLNKLAGFLANPPSPSQAAEAAPAAVRPPPVPPVATAMAEPITVTAPPSRPGVEGRTAVLDRVRAVVAEKTGYPIEMLEPDLDLEADLGIDTVKQAELFGILRESFGIPRIDGVQLKDYNTLNKLAEFLLSPPASAPAAVPQTTSVAQASSRPVQVESTPETRVPTTTHRYVVRYVLDAGPLPEPHVLDGKTFLVWAPGSLRADLLYALKRAGAQGIALEHLPGRLEEATNAIEAQRRKTPQINGLVFASGSPHEGVRFEPTAVKPVKALFYLTKALLAGARTGDVDTIAVATFLGGDFANHHDAAINPLDGGLVGFAKAFARELPRATVKAIDFGAHTPPPRVAATLVEELARRDGLVEVGTYGGRGTLKLVEQETAEEEPGVELGPSDVLLASGGGTGITSDIVVRLARKYRCAIALLGRTPLAPEAPTYAAFTAQDWNGKRVEVQAALKAKGEKATPVAVDRVLGAMKKAAEIHSTIQAIQAAGAKAEYHAVDVTDSAAVTKAVDGIRRTLGPITGILHAAGVEESKLIVDKTSDSFDRVFDVKVLGARSLLAATQQDAVRLTIAFSSIAGRFGNAGQADYSAANDALAKLCAALRNERPNMAATAIDWSAWDEKGMATRGSIMTVLKEAGVTPIPLAEGVQRFLDEVAHGMREAEIVVSGALGRFAPEGILARPDQVFVAPVQATSRAEPIPASSGPGQQVLVMETPQGGGNLITTDVQADGRSASATFVLDPGRDPYLRDHSIDGVPYLPGVFGQEAFAEVAQRLAPGRKYTGARDVEFRLPVKVLRDRPLEVTVVASVAQSDDQRTEVGCRLQSVFTNAKGERMGAPRIHFTGTLVFEDASPTPPPPPGPGGDLERLIEQKEIYKSFFHGPSFRVLDRVGFDADGTTTIGIWADPRAPLFGDRKPHFLTNPMMRELAYQTAGSYELFKNRWLSLPKADGRLIYYRDAPAQNAAVRCFAKFKGLEESVARFDVIAATPDGDVLFEIQDFQLIRLRPLEGATATPSPAPHPTEVGAGTPIYKARWGVDVPMPLMGATGVLVRQDDLERQGTTANESLTAGERSDQERYRNTQRSAEFFAGRLAAKEAIATLLNRPVREARGIEIRRLETGEPQPRGSGMDGVLVSITHTGRVAYAAAARRDRAIHTIGLDAEKIEPKPNAFELEAFTAEERRLIDRLQSEGADRATLVVRFWAVKEAVLKTLGKGFALDVQDVRVTSLDAEERATVTLAPPARQVMTDLGVAHVRVQTWIRDGLAFALAWTHA